MYVDERGLAAAFERSTFWLILLLKVLSINQAPKEILNV